MPDEFIPRPRRSVPQENIPAPQPSRRPLRRIALLVALALLLAGSALLGFSIFRHETPLQLIAD
ncbi:MAG TPA: hypothetical protein VMV73_05030, partial [Candidatus Dormibacteraeota bacterium]|nr:hypothetical protein [Candidatus Dormibacteraeota bacterium]